MFHQNGFISIKVVCEVEVRKFTSHVIFHIVMGLGLLTKVA
jgi:hypothetical protein